jgi:hypothetical protein
MVMRRRLMVTIAAAAMVACGAPAASASPSAADAARPLASGTTWGTAEEVPGTAALNTQGQAGVSSVSCPSAGNCGVAGGYTTLINNHVATRPYVDTETNGVWRTARQVPGFDDLSPRPTGLYTPSFISCAPAGNCSAGGSYSAGVGGGRPQEAFVVTETDGTWGKAGNLTGLPGNSNSAITSVSCTAAGDCSAGGYYYANEGGDVQAFVLDETAGVWGTAEEVPGTAALNTGADAEVTSVSCTSPGNCSAGGNYVATGHQVFVVNETGGVWGTAEEVPGTAALNTGADAELDALSCGAAGDCSAGGYLDDSKGLQAFVVSEKGGTWNTARKIPAITGSDPGQAEEITAVSCGAADNCSAGGYYYDTTSDSDQAFVVSKADGTWGTPEEIPGIGALGSMVLVSSVSCHSVGTCAMGGYTESGVGGAWVVSETAGTWGTAQQVPGTTADSGISSVSCSSATDCVAGGDQADSSGDLQAIVVSRT